MKHLQANLSTYKHRTHRPSTPFKSPLPIYQCEVYIYNKQKVIKETMSYIKFQSLVHNTLAKFLQKYFNKPETHKHQHISFLSYDDCIPTKVVSLDIDDCLLALHLDSPNRTKPELLYHLTNKYPEAFI